MLVAIDGMTISASASWSGSAKLMMPMAISGSPMPTAPLAMPATMKAPAATSICASVIVRERSGGSGKELGDEARVAFADLPRDQPAHGGEGVGVGQDCRADRRRAVELEACIVADLFDRVAGMHGLQPESPARLVEREP